MPADKAQHLEERLANDAREWFTPDAVRERTAGYLEKVASQKPNHVNYEKERNDLIVGFRAKYPSYTDWQMQALDWLCGIYFGTMTNERINNEKGLLLVGPTGTGKTALFAFAQQHPLIKYRIRTAYEIKRMAETGGTLALDDIKKSKWLMIDDLGMEGKVMYMGNLIYPIEDILHYRYEHGLMTHITMNYGAASHYDGRITDRMKAMCNIISIDKQAKSFRQ